MKHILRKVVLWGFISVVTVLFVQIVYIRLRDNYRYNYCQNFCFEYLDDSEFTIHPFYSREKEEFIVVLPQYWDAKDVVAKVEGKLTPINWVNDEMIEVQGKGKLLLFRTRQNTLFVNTESGSMEQIDASVDKSWKESGSIKVVDNNGRIDYCNDFESIHGRGGSTWLSTIKKAYNLNTGSRVSLLGMREGKKWCLLANSQDRTNAKNYIAYYFAKELQMPFAVDQQYVSLYLNGNYNGLYLLTNSIKDNKRDFDYLVRLVRPGEPNMDNMVELEVGERVEIERPKKDYDLSAECIKNDFNTLITNIREDNQEWMEMLDVRSFAMNYLMNDFFLNDDYGNFYIYKDAANGILRASSIWDFDHTMGASVDNHRSMANYPNMYVHRRGYEVDGWEDGYHGLISLLNNQSEFKTSMNEIFVSELSPLFEQFFEGDGFEKLRDMLEHENMIDYIRWYPGGGQVKVDYLRSLMELRYAFYSVDYNQEDSAPVYTLTAKNHFPDDNNTRVYEFRVKKGDMFEPPLWPSTKRIDFYGWKDDDGNDLTNGFVAVSDTTMYAQWKTNSYVPTLGPALRKWLKYLFIGEY